MTSTTTSSSNGDLAWRAGVVGGALVGGLFWGLVAALTIGAPGDATSHAAADTHRLMLAAVVWLVLAAVGVALARFGGYRHLRTVGLTLVVGPTGGWLVLGSLVLQTQWYRWGMS
ncbi:hypothetical protein H7K45_30370 [Mycobacterium yunnanensis]|uniref:Uncharacterized protein n=1 Tax=Mycobacterium yunnanensis TaxID=368477 RepID=A0A9X2ZAV8_9MYCO|nr:hypothetical protein [Mycobacterium yunnanensis]MCV7424854.1 hypothetical protein [Mycobacterium yunnanensis]